MLPGKLRTPLMLATACCGLWLAASLIAQEPGAPAARALWQNTRLIGSPEPPAPYTVEKVFPQLDLRAPLYVAPVPGSDLLFVVLAGGEADRPAKLLAIANQPEVAESRPVLELERRLIYGITFHPKFAENGFLYVFSNGPWNESGRRNRVSRYKLDPQDPAKCDPASELIILEWASGGHDGGDLAFGTDRLLYITSGDGTSDSDGYDSGQDITNLLATLIRIDVDHPAAGQPYGIPPDNPFVNHAGARPEIWAYGFRNPWRMGIDERTGDIWVGNNGQDQWETAHLVHKADNYGWSVYEGRHPFHIHRRRGPTPIVPPTIEHPHSEFRSLTGGVVYYGAKFPELEGMYLYGDYSTGKIWGARHKEGQLTFWEELADTTLQIAAFRVDQGGELLVVDHGGGIYRLAPNTPTAGRPVFPTQLSESGLFASTLELRPAVGVIPYSVNAAAWTDGAAAERLLALPGDAKIGFADSRGWNFPNGTALVQTLTIDLRPGDPKSRRRVETRLLLRQDNEWAAYAYRWNDEQTDATLLPRQGAEWPLWGGDPGAARTWRSPSRTECMTCHSRAANYVLGLTTVQMNRNHDHGSGPENQLAWLARAGVFADKLEKPLTELAKLVEPRDPAAPLEARARSYLHANCAGCHIEAGGGNAQMELEFTREQDRMRLVGVRPLHDTFGLGNAMLVAPGQPAQSVLIERLSRRGPGQMPPLGSHVVDEQAVSLMREWIGQLKPARPLVRQWQIDELLPAGQDALPGDRSPQAGRELYGELGCAQCHKFHGQGGAVGPELTGTGKRLGARGLLEAILTPSKTIPPEYALTIVETADGRAILGRVDREDEHTLVLRSGANQTEMVSLAKAEIAERRLSDVSNMPSGIVDVLHEAEVLDLIAYLLADRPETAEKP